MDDDVGAELERATQIWCGEGVVDHQRHAVGVGDLGHGLDVEHVAARVADGLAVDQLRLVAHRIAPRGGFVRVDERQLQAAFGSGVLELGNGAAVQRSRRDDVVARAAAS